MTITKKVILAIGLMVIMCLMPYMGTHGIKATTFLIIICTPMFFFENEHDEFLETVKNILSKGL